MVVQSVYQETCMEQVAGNMLFSPNYTASWSGRLYTSQTLLWEPQMPCNSTFLHWPRALGRFSQLWANNNIARNVCLLLVNTTWQLSLTVACSCSEIWVNSNLYCGQVEKWAGRNVWRWISVLRVAPAVSSRCSGSSWIFQNMSTKSWARDFHDLTSECFLLRHYIMHHVISYHLFWTFKPQHRITLMVWRTALTMNWTYVR
jgi:hypothetical protein